MATTEELRDSLDSFAQSCNENARLVTMNKDWNRTIHVHATDGAGDYTIITNQGLVRVEDGAPAVVDMGIIATGDILTQIFYGEVSPNEPYGAGTLRVQGSEADVLHLDFITAMLWE